MVSGHSSIRSEEGHVVLRVDAELLERDSEKLVDHLHRFSRGSQQSSENVALMM